MISQELIYECAQLLLDAERSRSVVEPLTAKQPDLSIEDAYIIQQERVRLSGSKVTGIKAALTSRAKQLAMGVDKAGYGLLTKEMLTNGAVDTSSLIHPRVEPEVALFFEQFHQSCELTPEDISRRMSGYAIALEVIDSRFKNFKFTAADVFADNCSSARYIVAERSSEALPSDIHLRGVILERNGLILQTGTPAAVLGHPLIAAAFILNSAFAHKVELPGSFVLLTGGITEAIPVVSGDHVTARFSGMGSVSAQFV